jgi:hypothetical protein
MSLEKLLGYQALQKRRIDLQTSVSWTENINQVLAFDSSSVLDLNEKFSSHHDILLASNIRLNRAASGWPGLRYLRILVGSLFEFRSNKSFNDYMTFVRFVLVIIRKVISIKLHHSLVGSQDLLKRHVPSF